MALKEYHLIDKETGFPVEIGLFDDEIDTVPEGYVEGWGQEHSMYKPRYDLEKGVWVEAMPIEEIIEPLRESKINQLDAECQAHIKAGFYCGEDFFGFNDIDQTNFNQQLSLLLLDETQDTVYWKTENNGVKYFKREQFIEACKAGEVHKRNSISHYWLLKHYVMTHPFTSVEELNAIDFNFKPNLGTNTNVVTDV